MTDQPQNPDHPNDPLGDALRNEVPAPAPGYWEAIDARLANAAAERSADPVIHLDHPAPKADTGDTVIRLTDMNTTAPSPTNPTRGTSPTKGMVLALAAAAALILGVVGFAALRTDAPTPVESAATTDGTNGTADGTDAGDDTEATPDGAEEPVDSLPGDEFAEEPAAEPVDEPKQAETIRRCFYEQYLPDDEPDPTVVLIVEIGPPTNSTYFRSMLEFPDENGEPRRILDEGIIDAEGKGLTESGATLRLFDDRAERFVGGVEPFTAVEVACSSIDDADDRFARLDVPDNAELATPFTGASLVGLTEVLVGLTEVDAQVTVEEAGFIWRVVARDGEQVPVFSDQLANRINAVIVDGIVTETSLG